MTQPLITLARRTLLEALEAAHPKGLRPAHLQVGLKTQGLSLTDQQLESQLTHLTADGYLTQQRDPLNGAESLYILAEKGRVLLADLSL